VSTIKHSNEFNIGVCVGPI